MREILFRAKRVCNDEWIEGFVARVGAEVSNIVDKEFEILVPVYTETIGQFTGLTDKNGKKIFEGDILGLDEGKKDGKQSEFGEVEVLFGEYDDSDCEYGSEGIGWYVNGYYGFYRISGEVSKYPVSEESLLRYNREYEIIGNIHDNE